MASFSPHIAPESLDNVLNSLETLLGHHRQARQQRLHEPYSNQPAEQYDDPLILEESPASVVREVMPQKIPVLKDVVRTAPSTDKILNELRLLLSDIVDDIMLDARDHLQDQHGNSQQVMETSLKQFLHELTERLPR